MNVTIQEVALQVDDCWNRIGVFSQDRPSCPLLEQFVHCRNCMRYSSAGREILNRPAPDSYRAEWAERYAQPHKSAAAGNNSVLLFRLGNEWLGLESRFVNEITEFRPIHRLPHKNNDVIKGLVNIRGELKICVSIGNILDLEKALEERTTDREIHERMIYVANGENSFVFPVSEVHGIHRYADSALEAIPLTVARSRQAYSTGILPWQDNHVGILDYELLFYALENSLQ